MTEEERERLLKELRGTESAPAIPDRARLLEELRGGTPAPAPALPPAVPVAPARATETQLSRPTATPSAMSAATGTQDKVLTAKELEQVYTRGGDPSLISRAITPQPFIPDTQFDSITSTLPYSELRTQDQLQAARTGQAPGIGSVLSAMRPRVVDPFATVTQFEPTVAEFQQLARTPAKDQAEIETRVQAIKTAFPGDDTVSKTLRGYYEAAARGLFPEQDIPSVSNSIRQVVAQEADRSWFDQYISQGGVRGALARAGQIAFSPKVSGQDLVEPGLFTALRALNFPFAVAGGALEATFSAAAGDPTPFAEGLAMSAQRYVREGRGIGDAVSQGLGRVASPLGDTAEGTGAVLGFGLGFIADAFAPGKLSQLGSSGYKAVGRAKATSQLAEALGVADSGGMRSVIERATESARTQVLEEVQDGTRKLTGTATQAAAADVREKLYKQIADQPAVSGLLLDEADVTISSRFLVPKDIAEELQGKAQSEIDDVLASSTDPRVLEKARIGDIVERMTRLGNAEFGARLAKARQATRLKETVFTPPELKSWIGRELEALETLRADFPIINPAIQEVVDAGRNETASIFDMFRLRQQRMMKEQGIGFQESFYRVAAEPTTVLTEMLPESMQLPAAAIRSSAARVAEATPEAKRLIDQAEDASKAREQALRDLINAVSAKREASKKREGLQAALDAEAAARDAMAAADFLFNTALQAVEQAGVDLRQTNLAGQAIATQLELMRIGELPSALQRDDFFARYIDTIFGGSDAVVSALKTRGGTVGEEFKPEAGYWLSRAVQDTPAMRKLSDDFYRLLDEKKTKEAMALLESIHFQLEDLNVVPAIAKAMEEGWVHPTTMFYLNRTDALSVPRGVKLPAVEFNKLVAANYALDEQRKILDRVAARLAQVAPSVLTPAVMDLVPDDLAAVGQIVKALGLATSVEKAARAITALRLAYGKEIHTAATLDALDYLLKGGSSAVLAGEASPRLSAIKNALAKQEDLAERLKSTLSPEGRAALVREIALAPDEWRKLTPDELSMSLNPDIVARVEAAISGLNPKALQVRIEEAARRLEAGPIVDTPVTRLETLALPPVAKRQLLSAQSVEDLTDTLTSIEIKGKPTEVIDNLAGELLNRVKELSEGKLTEKRAKALAGATQALDFVGKIGYLNNLAKGGVLNGFLIPNMVYHAGNIMSAPFIMNTTVGPTRTLQSVRNLGRSLKLLLKGGGPDEKIVGQYTRREIEDMLAQGSIMRSRQRADLSQSIFRDFETWQQDSLPKKLWRTLDPASPTSYLARFADSTDAVFRTSTVLSALEEGMSPEQAVRLGREALLDYGKLTDIERKTLAKYLWFYTFWSKNLTATVNATLTRPGSIAAQYRIMNGLDRSTNATSDDMSYASPWADTRIFREVLYDPQTAQRYALTGTDVPALSALADIMSFGKALLQPTPAGLADAAREFLPGPGLLPQWILGLGLGVTWDAEPVSNYVDPRLLYWAETFDKLDLLQAIVPMEKESDPSKTRGRTTFRGEVWKVKPEHERTWFALQQAMLTGGFQRTVRDWAPAASQVTGTDIQDFRLQSMTPGEAFLRNVGALRPVTDPTRTDRRKQIERERVEALRQLK